MSLADLPSDPLSPQADRLLYGLRVASSIPLPGLLPWTGDDRVPDVFIDLGPVPERLHPLSVDRPLLQVAVDGTCRYAKAGVAVWLVSPDGRRITIDPVLHPSDAEIRTYLLGTVFAIVCARRRLLPLHASCLRIGHRAVVFSGHSGAGKSTLAALLVRRGFPLIADDVTVVDLAAVGAPQVLPAFPRVKLWRDAMERLVLPMEEVARTRSEIDKFHVPVEDDFCATPLPLSAIIVLEPTPAAPPGLRHLSAMAGLAQLGEILYRPEMMVLLGLKEQQMRQSLQLTAAVGGIMALRRPDTPAALDELIAALTG